MVHVRNKEWFFVIVLLTLQLMLLGFAADSESQTIDEAAHLASGVSYLTTGDFRLNPEHPPFVKLLAGSSALLAKPRVPLDDPSWDNRDQWEFGRAFLYRNTVSADTLLFLGRLPVIAMTVLLALAVFLITRALLGRTASFIALLLSVIAPNVLAHGHYVTTDIPFTLFFFLSIAYFWWAFHTRHSLALLTAAVLLALAHITKFSALVLWPILLVLGFAAILHSADRKQALRFFTAYLGVSILITAVFIFAIYGFSADVAVNDPVVANFYAHPEQRDTALPFIAAADSGPLRDQIAWIARRVPIPAFDYMRGMGNVILHNYYGHTAYLLGDVSEVGWWYYFPIALFVKLPAGVLVLAGLGLVGIIAALSRSARAAAHAGPLRRRLLAAYRSLPLAGILFALAPLLYLLISMNSTINLGVRHILPIFPFIFILAALPFTFVRRRFQRAFRSALWGILFITVLAFGVSAPYFTSYFSEFIGGRLHGPAYLLDSNYDWGQDAKRLRTFLEHTTLPEPVSLSFFGSIDIPRYLGRNFAPVPTDAMIEANGLPTSGTVIISAGQYYSRDSQHTWLRRLPATAIVGTSIFVFTFP